MNTQPSHRSFLGRPLSLSMAIAALLAPTTATLAADIVASAHTTKVVSGDHSREDVLVEEGATLIVDRKASVSDIHTDGASGGHVVVVSGGANVQDVVLGGSKAPPPDSPGVARTLFTMGEAGQLMATGRAIVLTNTDAHLVNVELSTVKPESGIPNPNLRLNTLSGDRSSITVENSTVLSGRTSLEGVYSQFTVKGSRFTASGWGAIVEDGSTLTATDSVFHGGSAGVVIDGGTHAVLDHVNLSADGKAQGPEPIDATNDAMNRDLFQGGLVSVGASVQSAPYTQGTSPVSVTIGNHSELVATGGVQSAGLYAASYGPDKSVQISVGGASRVTGDGYGLLVGRFTPFVTPVDYGAPGHVAVSVGDAVLTGQRAAVEVTGGQEAQINLASGAVLHTSDSGYLIEATQAKTRAHVIASGTRLAGALRSDDASALDVTLAQGAVLTGVASGASTAMHINDSSVWNLPASATIGALSLNNGQVVLPGAYANQDARIGTLQVAQFSGQGAIALHADLAHNTSDRLAVIGRADGQYVLAINDSSHEGGGVAVPVVTTGGGAAIFQLQPGRAFVDAGTYKYALEQTGSSWSLVPTRHVTPPARAIVSVYSVSPTVWYGEMGPLRTRMGDLRRSTDDQGGFWARGYFNRYHVNPGHEASFDQSQAGLSIGGDARWDGAQGHGYTGLVFNVSRSHLRTPDALPSSQVSSYSLGAYGSWYSDNGYYVDAIGKLNHFGNDVNALSSDRHAVSGNYHNHGWGGQVEGGRHIEFAGRYFVEPYALLSALWVSGKRYEMDNGLQANDHTARSFQQSAGVTVGGTFEDGQRRRWQPYVRLAAIHESANDNVVSINDNALRVDLSGLRGEAAVGLVANLSARSSVYAEVSYAKGHQIEQPISASLGMRLRF